MESMLQKWGWIAHLLVIAVAAILLASAAAKYVAVKLAPYTVPEAPKFAKPAKVGRSTPTKRAQSFAKTIVDRCLFGCDDTAPASECPDGCPAGEVCQSGACVPAVDSNASSQTLVASDIGAKLLGAMVALNPDYSVALFSDAAAKATYILGVGESLMGQAEIVEIRRDRVIIRRNNRLEYIRLENSLGGAPTLTSAAARLGSVPDLKGSAVSKNEPRPKIPSPKGRKKKVDEVSEGVFELDRVAVNAELGNAEKLAKAAKVVPNYVNGKSAGIKLIGVRGDSVYSQLGIESGDVVTTINGTKVKNQAHAFELMQKLKNARGAEIEIDRRGKSKTLKYSIK